MLVFLNTLWSTIKMNFFIKLCMAAVIAILTKLFGDNYTIYEALVILVGIDFFTSLIASIKREKKITSADFRHTIFKMTLYAFFMASTYQLQRIIPALDFLDVIAISFLAVTEFLSIVENLSAAGLIIPKWIINRLEKYLETGQIDTIKDKNLRRIKS